MFYAAFPPEFNSGRMYSGPGSGSMRAAATAWKGLATELQSTVSSYSSVIESLTSGSWVGPSSVSMAAAVTPYLAWMQDTAAQAAEAATQAIAAATAYETAFAAHVPPAEIAANRSQLAQLVATNVFGQNTSAIAATEIQYGEMWAQDALAMDSYASSSAAASNVDAVHRGAADHQRRRGGQPGGRGDLSRRHARPAVRSRSCRPCRHR